MAAFSTPTAASRNASPFLYGTELDAVAEALRLGQYGHSALTETFERDVAGFLGVPDVVAVATGTDALEIALRIAGIGPGHEVIVPSQTFCASVHAILACGASPRFTEVSPDTLCIDGAVVLGALTPATRAVMPVLYGGRAVDLTGIRTVLDERGITVVEDAAHAFGSYLGPTRVGATGALTCFSFGPIKNLTCGQGGALIPRTPAEADAARRMRLLGIGKSQTERINTTSYTVEGVGLRTSLSSINAAIGSAQLPHFPATAAKRQALWRGYRSELEPLGDVALVDVDVDHTVPFNCVVKVPARDRVFRLLHDQGIGVGVHYPPNHLQPAFAAWHRPLPITETLGQQILSLPFHPAMNDDDVHHVVSALGHALRSPRGPAEST